MLKDGMFIQNRYEIISKIGSGGMADVYKAKDHKLNRFVAVKVMKKEFREDRDFISKFRVEAQSAAGLAHANIVNVYDVGEEAGIYYIVMELVEGITLKEYIRNKGRLSVREATSIALQISAGLEAAHNNGIIHRDVKPQNIIISTDGKVKVADFGIARASTANTINSNVMGSVHYSSPEQSRGGYSDEKSDIYSLGITMYEMLTGHVPFDGDTAVAVAIRHLQEELRGPKEVVPEIPYSTNQIVLKCTQKSPDRRYSNMTELIRDLRESLVNPDGDFVSWATVDNTSQTIIMSKNEVDQIKAEQRNMPSYDESLDVGAAAGLHEQENGPRQNRAYQPGSYYQKTAYQEVSPGRPDDIPDAGNWQDDYTEDGNGEYDPYYDAYDDPNDYAIHEGRNKGDYRLEKSFVPKKEKKNRSDEEIGLNPKLEKAVTVGGIIVAVIIGCVFLVMLANAFGLLNFRKKVKQTEPATEAVTETEGIQQVSVPSILGKSEKDAAALLKSYGLTGKKKGETDSDTYGPGEVCSQSPESGNMVDQGSVIEYEIVPAEEEIVLSDLSNVEQSQAQAFLLTKGLQCTVDTSRQSDTVEPGYVITTEPAAGTKMKPGETVTLFVNQEATAAPEDYVTLWSLYGYTQERAEEAVAMLDLVPAYEYEASDTVGSGMIISQKPAANEPVPRGSTVTLVISTGPAADAGQDTAAQNGDSTAGGIWKCDASLEQPTGYNGQSVRITLSQNGTETTVYEGTTTFPYHLNVEGMPGVETGTAYVYLLDPSTGEVTSTIEYPGITFGRTN
ncbi:MAG: Stk1 family PASTA domain-containing Ser/Thr kinase [Candidatus Choladocola sp.]|nr:Stk1 family PASTA domain-containing Ser/Thr kinase [Candidatus Choladocola sp.]